MLGLPKAQYIQAIPSIKEQGNNRVSPQWRNHGRRSVLVPMMVGSMMILAPRREDGGQLDLAETIPPIES